MKDYPDLQPWQEQVLEQFKGRGALQVTGRQMGKSWANWAMQQAMDGLVDQPVRRLIRSSGTIFDQPYLTVQVVGGNWNVIHNWCTESFGASGGLMDFLKDPATPLRWYIHDSKVWFQNQQDCEWFILRWT